MSWWIMQSGTHETEGQTTRRAIRWPRVLIAGLIIGSCAVWYGAGSQQRNMDRAAEVAARIEPLLAAQARFDYVAVQSFTSHNGCLLVDGAVFAEADLIDLQSIVDAARPSTYVRWNVDVTTRDQHDWYERAR